MGRNKNDRVLTLKSTVASGSLSAPSSSTVSMWRSNVLALSLALVRLLPVILTADRAMAPRLICSKGWPNTSPLIMESSMVFRAFSSFGITVRVCHSGAQRCRMRHVTIITIRIFNSLSVSSPGPKRHRAGCQPKSRSQWTLSNMQYPNTCIDREKYDHPPVIIFMRFGILLLCLFVFNYFLLKVQLNGPLPRRCICVLGVVWGGGVLMEQTGIL